MRSADVARSVTVAALVAGLLYVAWLLRDVVLLAVLAGFVAVALSAPVAVIQRRLRLPRAAAILLVYVLIASFLVAIGLLIVPPFVTEVEHLLRALPRYVRELEDSALIARWDKQYDLIGKLQSQADRLPSLVGGAVTELETVTVGALERIVELVAVLAVAFLLLLDAPRLLNFVFEQLLPEERREQARRVAQQSASAVGGYVAGVFAVAALAGLVSFFVMTILGIPYAVPLAALMALFAIVPLVGSVVGAAAIAFVAAFSGVETAVAWIVFFVIYQQCETHIIGPFVYRRAVDMRPVLVILAVLAGATLLGVLGALLAIPAAATIQIAVREWWALRQARRAEAAPGEPAPADAMPPGAAPADAS
ncbi:AI-2E family transporter [Conexibacter stalactiti]|uniref:AI-2E family transporter n=1 Tax=Conexibacter stalactiti TaxID=1940611 RepID=A0ABU4HR05_9ACTN|nr:AI-2E family transporter [Conexibacter stalactiti]MDW5595723.1 AI-2E family transporter [Conexibacter stalactiti]MEC5036365.1 AI-2E family transporter [Conexibacter stalactiti]